MQSQNHKFNLFLALEKLSGSTQELTGQICNKLIFLCLSVTQQRVGRHFIRFRNVFPCAVLMLHYSWNIQPI